MRARRSLALVLGALTLVGCDDLGCAGPRPSAPELDPPTAAPPDFGDAPGEPTDRRLVVGDGWTCALGLDRVVRCFGRLPFEQLPDEDPVVSAVHPVEILEGAVELSGGVRTLCARDARGTVLCTSGEPPAHLRALDGAQRIGAAGNVVCGTFEGGRVRCAREGTIEPDVAQTIEDAVDVREVGARVCARRREHPVVCWSGDAYSIREETIEGASGAVAIAEVNDRPCPIGEDGRVRCAAVRELGFAAVAFESRGARSCGIDREGTLRCLEGRDRFVAVEGEGRAEALRVGPSHACVFYEGERLECWGDDSLGQSSGTPPPPEDTITRVGALPPAAAVALSEGTACALDTQGSLRCWTALDPEPWALEGLAGITSITATRGAICGRGADGSVSCVRDGSRTAAPLAHVSASRALVGDPRADILLVASDDGVELVELPGSPRAPLRRRALSALSGAESLTWVDHRRACGVRAARLVCDGDGAEAEPAMDELAALFGGGGARFAVKRDGTVWAWGQSFGGMLGVPPGDAPSSPLVEVPGLERPGRIVTSTTASCAWSQGAPLSCAGVLGPGPTRGADREAFGPLPGVGGVRDVALSGSHGCVVDAEGITACWGTVRGDGHPRAIARPTRVALTARPSPG